MLNYTQRNNEHIPSLLKNQQHNFWISNDSEVHLSIAKSRKCLGGAKVIYISIFSCITF